MSAFRIKTSSGVETSTQCQVLERTRKKKKVKAYDANGLPAFETYGE